jgi:hypothetical protein
MGSSGDNVRIGTILENFRQPFNPSNTHVPAFVDNRGPTLRGTVDSHNVHYFFPTKVARPRDRSSRADTVVSAARPAALGQKPVLARQLQPALNEGIGQQNPSTLGPRFRIAGGDLR